LTAEGEKQSAILRAEGDRESQVLRAEGQAQAIGAVFQAVHRNDADPKVLAYQYLQTLPQLAHAQGNTFWVIPSEVTTALKTLSGAFSGESENPPAISRGRHAEATGAAAAALAAGGPLSTGPGANGDLARAEQAAAEEAARTTEEVAQVEQEVAAVQRQVAEAEQITPR
jgi:hypothetical protein